MINTRILTKWLKNNEPNAVEKLAIAMQVSTKTIQRIQSNEHDLFVGTASKLAAALGTTLDQLLKTKHKEPKRAKRTD